MRRLLTHPVTIGLVLRLGLAWLLPTLLDDGPVAYTDIDFHVFSDAAVHIQQGGSPYDRTTYRYTPFLAALLAVLPTRESGRYLLCIADFLAGWILWTLQRQQRARQAAPSTATKASSSDFSKFLSRWLSRDTQDALWWLYNPLAINICTRGSAESLLVLLPVLGTVWCVTRSEWSPLSRALTAGLVHGMAMHSKVYPVIYSLALATVLSPHHRRGARPPGFWTWIRGFLTLPPILFGIVALATFGGLTAAAVHFYGRVALDEGLLYHFSRVDHRHNYSSHWYWIYLARASAAESDAVTPVYMHVIGKLLLVPQVVLLIVTSWQWAGRNLEFCLFVLTLAFVAQNKVITAQYFTWYLCLLPLCAQTLRATRRVAVAVGLLLVSIVLWLLSAYLLELQGWAVHATVWAASLVFYAAHVNLLVALLDSAVVMIKTKAE